jgi:LemA protein
MKHPWIAFTAICSLVMGIVLICVIFGGYSSLVRCQSRINTVKQMLADPCTAQVALALRLTTLAHDFGREKTDLERTAQKLKAVLIKMAAAKDPLSRDLIKEFETAQNKITQGIEILAAQLKDRLPSEKIDPILLEQEELNTTIIVMVKQYNKQASYFNTRSRQFPGMFIEKLFSLDHLRFPEIIPPPLTQEETASAS